MHLKKLGLTFLGLAIILVVIALCIHRDPLYNWKSDGETLWGMREHLQIPKAILSDVEAYVHNVGLDGLDHIAFYENGSGQHAVKVTTMAGGDYGNYVLVYDKSEKRQKVIQYSSGSYGR